MKGPDFKKQSSTVSAARAMEQLRAAGFVVGTYDEVKPIELVGKAHRKDVIEARRQFGENAAISESGLSVILVGPHQTTHQRVEILVPLKGMIGHGAKEALEKKAGCVLKA